MDKMRARILLVDDDSFLAPALKRVLEEMGYAVVHMPTAAEALDYALQHHPDLVVMDVNLGRGIDGIDTARAMRRAYDVPVVFLTSRDDAQTRSRAELATPVAYLSKGCSPDDLGATLERALSRGA